MMLPGGDVARQQGSRVLLPVVRQPHHIVDRCPWHHQRWQQARSSVGCRRRPRLVFAAFGAAAGASAGDPGGQLQQPAGTAHRVPPLPAWPVTARVALRTGVYIAAFGLAVFCLPGMTFGTLFDASLVTMGWVRVGGVLASLYGFYYIGAALDDAAGRNLEHFYASTIAGRLFLSAAFAALVASRQCEPALLWLAAANAASSLLLLRAVRQRERSEAAGKAGKAPNQ